MGETISNMWCKDIDECVVGSGTNPLDCHAEADCINTQGSYACKCRLGFEDSSYKLLTGVIGMSDGIREETVGETSTKFISGIDCVDVDECVTGQHRCHFHAACTNTHGSYTCKCLDGYADNVRIAVDNYILGTNCIV